MGEVEMRNGPVRDGVGRSLGTDGHRVEGNARGPLRGNSPVNPCWFLRADSNWITSLGVAWHRLAPLGTTRNYPILLGGTWHHLELLGRYNRVEK